MSSNQIFYDDIDVGAAIPGLSKGPIRTSHVMRWSAAMENWHRIHYDWPFATGHDRLPDIMINGSWKQHVLAQLLKDWVGTEGWVWKIKFEYREMDLPGDIITAWGKVTGKTERGGLGYVDLDIGLRNARDVQSTKGSAVVVLPKRGGPPVPYPFVAPEAGPPTTTV